MAKVQIIQSVSGEHFNWAPGQVIEMPADEAEKWADDVRGALIADDVPADQTWDPAAPTPSVVLVEEDIELDHDLEPEPHGYLGDSHNDVATEPTEPVVEETADDEDEPETPEHADPELETPEAPAKRRGRRTTKA